MSWTNEVVCDMKGDGFQHAATLKSEFKRLESGSSKWHRKTVVIVDEAAMISTPALAELLGRAKQAGAKIILTGDDKQLASVERAGMFTVLAQQHGAATLSEVMRTKDVEYQRAFNEMHKGNYAEALQRFDRKGDIHWTETQREAKQALTNHYAAAVAADPSKKRMIFAHTNADVAALNGFARGVARAQGRLGENVKVRTAEGVSDFATGDRVQFTGNGNTAAAKRRATSMVGQGRCARLSTPQPAARFG